MELSSMKWNKHSLILVGVILFLYLLGVTRENTFLVINCVLSKTHYNWAYIQPPAFLYEFSDQHLVLLKWQLTVGFTLLFFVCNYLFFRVLFVPHKTKKIYLSVVVFTSALMIFLVALQFFLPSYPIIYLINRQIIGLINGPFFFMLLYVTFRYLLRFEVKNERLTAF